MAQKRGLPHIILVDPPERQDYTSKSGGGEGRTIPPRVREAHYQRLFDQLDAAWKQAEGEQAIYKADRVGIYLEFKGEPGFHLPYQSLESLQGKNKAKCVRLLNVRSQVSNTEVMDENEGTLLATETIATVFVPHAKKDYYFKALENYLNKETPSGAPKNKALVDSIAEIRKALEVESFWMDDTSLIPQSDAEWCEVWLSSDGNDAINRFESLVAHLGLDTQPGNLQFPERSVKLVRANRDQLAHLSRRSDDIAEFRLAKETAAFWLDQKNAEQVSWVKDLIGRVQLDPDARVSVCILDTGINNGHPLLSPVLDTSDCQCLDPAWGAHDHDRHGTLMAGVAVYGDLRTPLSHSLPVLVRHVLESVKILPPTGDNPRGLWGYITSQGVSLAEIQAPDRIRIICMAVSAEDTRDRGRPSSWSAALDQIASGPDDDIRRLIIVCAGNVPNELVCLYPEAQLKDSIHDPAQSWNALCAGAYTDLVAISDPTMRDYKPVAPQGGLSPFSTTSRDWSDDWPIKPEIVLEGGNAALDSTGFLSECDDLSLLSTYYDPQVTHFYPFRMTSAATAEAARMAAHIQSHYDN